jgi:hypothetical protein
MVLSLALRHFSRRNRISEARWDVMDVAYNAVSSMAIFKGVMLAGGGHPPTI